MDEATAEQLAEALGQLGASRICSAGQLQVPPMEGKVIGFVPTMGYFHEGHLALMRRARQECDVVVVSIYVSPLQFGPREDFQRYPRDLPRDLRLAESVGVGIAFVPKDEDMYPEGFQTFVDVTELTRGLEGFYRPGH